jgi:hypothetical protein
LELKVELDDKALNISIVIYICDMLSIFVIHLAYHKTPGVKSTGDKNPERLTNSYQKFREGDSGKQKLLE